MFFSLYQYHCGTYPILQEESYKKDIKKILTAGCALSVDMVELVIGLVAHCGDARLVGDVIEWDDVPETDLH